MSEKRVTSVDVDTGEMLDYTFVAIAKKQPCAFGQRWVQVSQDAMQMLAEIKSLEQMRVLMMLMSKVDFENWISVDQTEIASKIGMRKQHVNRAIKALIERQVLLKGPRVGHNGTYRLNPSFGWKGRAKGHREALRARMEEKGLSVVKTP